MIRILFGLLLGAALMYFLDPSEGSHRRQSVTGRGRRDKAGDMARDTYSEAKDRFTATATHARERARDTVDEARTQAGELAESTRERARAMSGNENA